MRGALRPSCGFGQARAEHPNKGKPSGATCYCGQAPRTGAGAMLGAGFRARLDGLCAELVK